MLKFFLPLALTSLALPAPAFAADADVAQQAVPYRDLDLTHRLGVAKLNARVNRALERVCGGPVHRPLHEAMTYRTCVTAARAEVAARVREVIGAARARADLDTPDTRAQASLSLFADP